MARSEKSTTRTIIAQIQYGDAYIQPLLVSAIGSRLSRSDFQLATTSLAPLEPLRQPLLQILQYEQISFELALTNPTQVLINAYVIRKALIRKHFLEATIAGWTAKRPNSVLKSHCKIGVRLDIDYVEYLDEALADAFEVRDSIDENAKLSKSEREWWILKPGMADGGNGIRLFSTEEQLRSIFEELEQDDDDDDEDEDEDDDEEQDDNGVHDTISHDEDEEIDGFIVTNNKPAQTVSSSNMYASQLRHFIAQQYIHPPLLIDQRKFHIRAYVLAVGALKVYVSRPMLALFAAAEYQAPWEHDGEIDLRGHLTNTCFQGSTQREGSVRAFWDLEDDITLSGPASDGFTKSSEQGHSSNASSQGWKESVFSQICSVTGELFEAAARNETVHFQVLPNAFELFGVDFMVDAQGTAWLLEVNAFPDFKQTGEDLKVLIECLMGDMVELAVKPFFFPDAPVEQATIARMVKVLDIDLGRR